MFLSPAEVGIPKPTANGEHRYCCPLCSDRKYHLYVNPNKQVWHCFRCGGGGRWRNNGGGLAFKGQAPLCSEPERRAPEAILASAYRILLATLPLEEHHLLHLSLVRRMTPEQIAVGQYRTLPGSYWRRRSAASRVADLLDPDGVPGFWRAADGCWTLAGASGLLIPVRYWDGRIRGVQVRREHRKPRYVWLTSRRLPDGAPAKAVYHVTWTRGIGTRRIWVTEGPLKADVAAQRLGEVVVAVPGINTWRGSGIVKDLRTVGVREVVLAYDADLQTNPYVLKAAFELCRALRSTGLRAWVATWSLAAGKGIDDLLLGGGEPSVTAAAKWMSSVSPAVFALRRASRILARSHGS